MKARGRRPSAFIVSRCLERLMKHEARVFDMTSQSRLKIQCNKACKKNVFPAGMVSSSCKSLPAFRSRFSLGIKINAPDQNGALRLAYNHMNN